MAKLRILKIMEMYGVRGRTRHGLKIFRAQNKEFNLNKKKKAEK